MTSLTRNELYKGRWHFGTYLLSKILLWIAIVGIFDLSYIQYFLCAINPKLSLFHRECKRERVCRGAELEWRKGLVEIVVLLIINSAISLLCWIELEAKHLLSHHARQSGLSELWLRAANHWKSFPNSALRSGNNFPMFLSFYHRDHAYYWGESFYLR